MTHPGEQPPTAPGPPQHWPDPSRPAPGRRRIWIALAGVGIIAVILAAIVLVPRLSGDDTLEPAAAAPAVSASAPAAITVRGSLKLTVGDFAWNDGFGTAGNGPSCYGDGGFDDITVGAAVTVTDAAGAVVGLGQVNSSNPTDFDSTASEEDQRPTTCTLAFTVTGVPPGKGFYGVEISHRGAVKFSEVALGEPVELSLG